LRATALALVAAFGIALAAPATQAAPAVPPDMGSTVTNLVPVAGGCGPGLYPRRSVDRYGRWRVRCVPRNYYRPAPYYPARPYYRYY